MVERKHRSLLNVARALRFQSCVPIHFWGYCLLTAAYLLNRTPSITGISPYELLFNKIPEYHDLRVFGCLCFATVVPHPTDKFAPRAVKGVFVGYPFGTKGFRVLDLETKQVFVSRDVVFHETHFPFQDIITPTVSQLFPTLSTYVDCDPLYTETINHTGSFAHTEDVSTTSLPTVQPTTSTIPSVQPTTAAARPQRHRHLPAKFSDFTGLPSHLANSIQISSSHAKMTSLSDFIEALPFDSTSLHFVATTTKIPEPTSYKQAIKHSCWCEAMSVELATLEAIILGMFNLYHQVRKLLGASGFLKSSI